MGIAARLLSEHRVHEYANGRLASQSVSDSTSRAASPNRWPWKSHVCDIDLTERTARLETELLPTRAGVHRREDAAKVSNYFTYFTSNPRRLRWREGCPGAHRRHLRERARASREHARHVLRTMVRYLHYLLLSSTVFSINWIPFHIRQ